MGVMGRANQKLGGSGDWLDKDELIRLRLPMAIVDVRFDRAGTSKFPGENWILTLEPWDNVKFPGPSGSLRFKNLPTRQGQFEDIAEQLEEARAQTFSADRDAAYIGPVALVSGLSAAKNRYKTLADVMVDEAGEIVLDSRGFPRIEGDAEPTETPAPAPVPTGPRRPSGTTKVQSVGQQERQEAERPVTAPAPAPAPAPQPAPQPAPAPAPKRGRRPNNPPAPLPPGTPAEVQNYEAQQQEKASTEATGPAPGVQQVTQQIPMATATCPHCNAEIGPNRVYPAAGGGFVIMHAHCPVKQDTVILTVDMAEIGEA